MRRYLVCGSRAWCSEEVLGRLRGMVRTGRWDPRNPPGGPDWAPVRIINEAFLRIASRYPAAGVTIVHGACPTGADAVADCLARHFGFCVERHPADWGKYGRRAGPLRNSEMVKAGVDWCMAFHTDINAGAGTRDALGKAILAGVHCMLFYGDTYEKVRPFGGPGDLDT